MPPLQLEPPELAAFAYPRTRPSTAIAAGREVEENTTLSTSANGKLEWHSTKSPQITLRRARNRRWRLRCRVARCVGVGRVGIPPAGRIWRGSCFSRDLAQTVPAFVGHRVLW